MKRKLSKSAFIRQHPSASPQQVSALAKKAGLVISPSYVSNVRWVDIGPSVREKKPAKKPVKKPLPVDPTATSPMLKKTMGARDVVDRLSSPDGPRVANTLLAVSGDGLVKAFKAMVVAIGTRVARQLITQVEDETSKLFGRPPV